MNRPTSAPVRVPHIETFVLGDFQTNCFVVSVPPVPPIPSANTPGEAETRDSPAEPADCWIVDCGFGPDAMFRHIDANALRPVGLLLTHTHADHMAGVEAARHWYPGLEVWLHEAERGFCNDPMLNLSAMLGAPITCAEAEHWLTDGDTLTLDGTTWRVVHTPGHSPGSAAFIHDESGHALVGDTLFARSIGRIDFPTSSPDDMRRTIANLMTLPDSMTVHPGHGPSTTIGDERVGNPFVVQGF